MNSKDQRKSANKAMDDASAVPKKEFPSGLSSTVVKESLFSKKRGA
ncbi:MAG: hypothetical protein FWE78_06075 [Methanimicrococcus sp.]|nr:hypothetical protein [Methanimicrococcus sp.]